jgi:glyceraldehyde-3-phosphate dehydrogenase (NADP+)
MRAKSVLFDNAPSSAMSKLNIRLALVSATSSVDLANNVDYGLQAGVFTRDLATAHRIADALNCGGVMIYDSSDYRIDAMPFGGIRGSGFGREGVAHAIHEMTDPKTYCFNL